MKVFRDDKAYVQLKDLDFLFRYSGSCIPQSIYKKALRYVYNMDEENLDDFIEFSEPEEVEFFKKDTYIIDLDEAIQLSSEEYSDSILSLQEGINKVVEKSKKPHKLLELARLKRIYRTNQHKIMSMKESRVFKKNNTSIDAHIKRRIRKD